jgi:hypothetical protein
MGLGNMKARAGILGATLDIRRGGTMLTCRLEGKTA